MAEPRFKVGERVVYEATRWDTRIRDYRGGFHKGMVVGCSRGSYVHSLATAVQLAATDPGEIAYSVKPTDVPEDIWAALYVFLEKDLEPDAMPAAPVALVGAKA